MENPKASIEVDVGGAILLYNLFYRLNAVVGFVAIIGVLYILSQVVYNLYLHPLNKYPGPFLGSEK
ncbi:hypothetical protein F5Y16DRAFT_367729 [Xylariaceae sp. FL0255]|nr:hypothetical protein F5Y16DRAFT_367729 [Xylariaceae sp. FL0255]